MSTHLIKDMATHQIEKFHSLVEPVTESGCLLWMGAMDKHGYGTMRMNTKEKQRNFFAHRLAYLIHHGELANELNVNHKCDVKVCVNPHHLYQGTQAENMRDTVGKRQGVPHPSAQGEKHPGNKLTAASVLEIRAKYVPRVYTARMLAEEYGVSFSTIQKIIYNVIWRYI